MTVLRIIECDGCGEESTVADTRKRRLRRALRRDGWRCRTFGRDLCEQCLAWSLSV